MYHEEGIKHLGEYTMKILFHIDENNRWPVLVGNIQNTLNWCNETGHTAEIEILANGEAVTGMSQDGAASLGISEALTAFHQNKVMMFACANALRGFEVDPSLLCEGVGVVPAGIIEIVEKQNAGFSYIRP